MRRTPQFVAIAAAVPLALALTLGGCSDDQPDEPKAGTSPASSSTATTSEPATPSEPSVAPATGPTIETPGATVNLPDGFTVDDLGLPNTASGSSITNTTVRAVNMIDLASTEPPGQESTDQKARSALTKMPGAKLNRQPDTELDGAPAYYVSGTDPTQGDYTEVGSVSHGRSLSIGLILNDYSPAERQEIVDSVIASFRWKTS